MDIRELSLSGPNPGSETEFFSAGDQTLEDFENLESLRLRNLKMDEYAWYSWMHTFRDTLIDLDVMDVNFYTSDNLDMGMAGMDSDDSDLDSDSGNRKRKVWILTEPMMRLETLRLDLTNVLIRVSALARSYSLQDIHLVLGKDTFNVKQLTFLNTFKKNVTITVDLTCQTADEWRKLMRSDSKFQVIWCLNKKITGLKLHGFEWNQELVIALEHAIQVCPNLVSLDLQPMDNAGQTDQAHGMAALASLFGDKERALKLRVLKCTCINEDVLHLIFQNCFNLDVLQIFESPVSDAHLTKWANAGAKPSRLMLDRGKNITTNGLVALLKASADRLVQFEFKKIQALIISCTYIWQVLARNCRFVKEVNGFGKCNKNLRSKFIRLV